MERSSNSYDYSIMIKKQMYLLHKNMHTFHLLFGYAIDVVVITSTFHSFLFFATGCCASQLIFTRQVSVHYFSAR